MLRVPVLVPAATGLKVTEIVQLAAALRVAPQVLVWKKSPLAVMLEIFSEAVPVLISVTVWGLLLVPAICAEKLSDEEDKLTRGAAFTDSGCGLTEGDGGRTAGSGAAVMTGPVPLSAIGCGLPAAFSALVGGTVGGLLMVPTI
jgi:hypothetical protein